LTRAKQNDRQRDQYYSQQMHFILLSELYCATLEQRDVVERILILPL